VGAAAPKIIAAAKAIGYEEACKANAQPLLLPLFSAFSDKKIVIEFKD
jgi:hypothetical protein